MILVDTREQVARLIVDDDELRAMITDLISTLSSRTVVALGRLLPS